MSDLQSWLLIYTYASICQSNKAAAILVTLYIHTKSLIVIYKMLTYFILTLYINQAYTL